MVSKSSGMDGLTGELLEGDEKVNFKVRIIPSGFAFNCFAFANGEEIKMEKFKKRKN